MIFDTITQTIGNTPLVKLNRLGDKLNCNVYGKCEFLNPGGSVKDRIAIRMIEEAEKAGRIKPGDTLIEPTSGNTGIGLALASAVKGYQLIITMPEKMSREKQVIMESLGAKIIRTPTEAAWDAPESHIGVAKRLENELPNAHILDQYANNYNPKAHYDGTAQEILDDLNGKVDMLVAGAGTGGTITGIARKIKEHNPKCIIVGADPVGSILAGGNEVGTYKVEGIGYDFIPDVLDREFVDKWVKTEDRESFLLSRRLISEEGLLVGGSSGSALFAALKEAKELPEDANCVVILPDGVRNYLSKFIDDKWMAENRFTDSTGPKGSVNDLIKLKKSSLLTLESSQECQAAIKLMSENGYSQIPITSDGKIAGMLYEKDLLNYLQSGQSGIVNSSVSMLMSKKCPTVTKNTPLKTAQELLRNSDCLVVVEKDQSPQNILTKIDLVEWLAKN